MDDSHRSQQAAAAASGQPSSIPFIDEKTVMGHRFVIQCYRIATEHTPCNRFAWQSWAMANYDLFTRLGVEKAQIEQKEAAIRRVRTRNSFIYIYLSLCYDSKHPQQET